MPASGPVRDVQRQPIDMDAIDKARVCTRARAIFGISDVYDWQLEVAEAILARKDVVLGVPTGGGKTMAFYLPLLHFWTLGDNEPDHQAVILVVSPLVELMREQATDLNLKGIPAVVMCAETMNLGDVLTDFASLRFRVGFVSPEIVNGSAFHTKVTSQENWSKHLLTVVWDEAHAISEWGGSFRPEYRTAGGLLRGRLPAGVPMVVASATMSPLLLEDLEETLHMRTSAVKIEFANTRPNVALSVRPIIHPEETMADLAFIFPPSAREMSDIPMTLVYVNDRAEAENGCDILRDNLPHNIPRAAVAFYHRDIGSKRKQEILELVRQGKIRVLLATAALGMGMNLRNIERVIQWKVPPTFSDIIQRAGRARRDLTQLGEFVLFVERSKMGSKEARGADAPAEARRGEDDEDNPMAQRVDVAQGGVRLEAIEVAAASTKVGRVFRKQMGAIEVQDKKYLNWFVVTTGCRVEPWNEFYQNANKRTLPAIPLLGARCCDNCMPEQFPVEVISLSSKTNVKPGRRRKASPAQYEAVRVAAQAWRKRLCAEQWPASFLITPSHILPDTVVEAIASSSTPIRSLPELAAVVRWAFSPKYGASLVAALGEVYLAMDHKSGTSLTRRRLGAGAEGSVAVAGNASGHTQGDSQPAEPGGDARVALRDALDRVFYAVKGVKAQDGRWRAQGFMALPSRELHGYYEQIPAPISMTQIQRRGKQYLSAEECARDWERLFDNARQYFALNVQVWEDAQELEACLRRSMKAEFEGSALPGAEYISHF